jgi:hypothetical protein
MSAHTWSKGRGRMARKSHPERGGAVRWRRPFILKRAEDAAGRLDVSHCRDASTSSRDRDTPTAPHKRTVVTPHSSMNT